MKLHTVTAQVEYNGKTVQISKRVMLAGWEDREAAKAGLISHMEKYNMTFIKVVDVMPCSDTGWSN